MRPIAIFAAACIAVSSPAGAQVPPPTPLYKDKHWLLHLHERDPLPICLLMATPTSNGELRRRLSVYVDGTANIARIEVNYPPQEYLVLDHPTTVAVDLGSTFTRNIKFRLLLHSTYPIIAARLSLGELEEIRVSLDGASGEMSLRFENGETWRFPPPQDRKLASTAADCWKSAVLADPVPSPDDDSMRCERHLSGCVEVAPTRRLRIGEPLTTLGRLLVELGSLQLYFTLGNENLHNERYDRAIEYYDKIIRIDPKFEKVLNQRGIAHLRSGRYDRAFSDFDQATRLDPSYSFGFGNRGLVYNQRGQYHLAIRDFDRAIRLNPRDWKFYQGRGNAKRAIGDIVGGDADLERASQLRRQR